ncbi:hypothetical protein [Candidatus Symbiopectobacterium sp.]|uniref:hypothetical protein n=1 Tax=Candidatus Symbiopectobacterium sp. TaxID=2816440 RepID=UPI0025C1D88A|nr:hypothetical protein [Candidatus Symbiopectobacterium sp.]
MATVLRMALAASVGTMIVVSVVMRMHHGLLFDDSGSHPRLYHCCQYLHSAFDIQH